MNDLSTNSLWHVAIGKMLDRIVGQTAPQADTNGDDESQSNLNAFGVVCDWVARRLIEAGKYSDSQFYSAQVTARRTFQQAAYLGETVLDYHYDNDWLKEYLND